MKKIIHFLLKKGVEIQQRKHYKMHWHKEIEEYKKAKDKKNKIRIFLEKLYLRLYWGCSPMHYIRYGFYKKDCKLSLSEMREYMPNFFAYFLFMPRYFGGVAEISRNKDLTQVYLKGLKLPYPRVIIKYDNNLFYDNENNLLSQEDAYEKLMNSGAEKLFIKPSEGLGGYGIIVFSKTEKGYITRQGTMLDMNFMKTHFSKGRFIVQEGIRQHPQMSKLFPGAVNTLRIVTLVEKDKPRILFAFLRMGRDEAEVDNASQGGIFCMVDQETGDLAKYAFSDNKEQFEYHPNTKIQFSRTTLPDWESTKKFILSAAIKCKELPFIGWDIAITEEGPVIIEMNEGPGIEVIQDLYGGISKILNVGNPRKWWFYDKFSTYYPAKIA
ncbi:MAG: sugar-transfer associated ATP-grasp domain-containing protein [Bacteroidales bacterium]